MQVAEILTYEELHRQLMYNPWTGYFYWKIAKRGVKIGNIAGSLNKKSEYIEMSINNFNIHAHRLVWFYVHGYLPENNIDHKDRVRYHNWISNLREVTQQCNLRNTGNRRNNTSGIKGIYWSTQKDKWHVRIMVNYKNKELGLYEDFDDAVCARLAGEQCLDWEGCDSNSPAYQYVKENIR